MTDKKFELELCGVSGSGKSAFIDFIIKACSQSEEWTTESIAFPPSGCRHHLIITHKKFPMPVKGDSHASTTKEEV